VLLPRIHRFVPTGAILEIAPGFGRWTDYLKELCRQLTVVDLTPKCIEACRTRFAHVKHISYHVNDGKSLAFVPDGSIDFVFSFDSLVHAERDVLEAYVAELARVLGEHGVAFIHHSNAGHYARQILTYWKVPKALKETYRRLASINAMGWRALSMTHEAFREMCTANKLACISQEAISWSVGRALIDTISVVTRPGSKWDQPYAFAENPDFAENALRIHTLSKLYSATR
jgi:ubiquinone/menaquinone biosynthesis C-methylase UbiE